MEKEVEESLRNLEEAIVNHTLYVVDSLSKKLDPTSGYLSHPLPELMTQIGKSVQRLKDDNERLRLEVSEMRVGFGRLESMISFLEPLVKREQELNSIRTYINEE